MKIDSVDEVLYLESSQSRLRGSSVRSVKETTWIFKFSVFDHPTVHPELTFIIQGRNASLVLFVLF